MASMLALVDVDASVDAMERQSAEGAVKVAEDLVRYEAIINGSRPEVIVECGTWRGGSALWFASRGVRVITIDVEDAIVSREAREHPLITCLTGNSLAPDVVATVRKLVSGQRVMVVLDSDHSPFHVRHEIEAYGQLVTVGCHLVVEDTILRWMPSPFPHPMPGPLDAVEVLLADDPGWRRDEDVERMSPISMHPAGWWIRAR